MGLVVAALILGVIGLAVRAVKWLLIFALPAPVAAVIRGYAARKQHAG